MESAKPPREVGYEENYVLEIFYHVSTLLLRHFYSTFLYLENQPQERFLHICSY